jgi:hypothetical protein
MGEAESSTPEEWDFSQRESVSVPGINSKMLSTLETTEGKSEK